jgi:hypothetical protein
MSSTPTGYGYPGRAIKTAAAFPWLGYSGDDPCAGERATDPLHRARIDAEAFGNDAHTGPPRSPGERRARKHHATRSQASTARLTITKAPAGRMVT